MFSGVLELCELRCSISTPFNKNSLTGVDISVLMAHYAGPLTVAPNQRLTWSKRYWLLVVHVLTRSKLTELTHSTGFMADCALELLVVSSESQRKSELSPLSEKSPATNTTVMTSSKQSLHALDNTLSPLA